MVFTIVADRKNSPSSGRPSTSNRTVCVKLPCATAAIARVTSVVGRSKSSTSVLTDPSISPHALRFMEARPLPGSSFLTDHLPHALKFIGHVLIGRHDFVKRVRNLPRQTRPRPG